MPERVESSLLVFEQFRDPAGTEWRPGDRAPLHRRAVRQVALERPELFAVEYATEAVDRDWLLVLDKKYEAEYEQAKTRRDEREAGRERALREELKEQGRPDPKDLERRYKAQQKTRAEREKQARENRDRQALEAEVALQRGSGFHH